MFLEWDEVPKEQAQSHQGQDIHKLAKIVQGFFDMSISAIILGYISRSKLEVTKNTENVIKWFLLAIWKLMIYVSK